GGHYRDLLTGLGDLRAALERVERPAALLGLRRLLAERLQRLIRKPDLEQVTGRDRVIATDHDDGREHLLQGPGPVLMAGRRPADEAAQEPAWAIDPEEADRLQRTLPAAVDRVGGLDPRPQLHPERAVGLGVLTAAPGHLGRDLLPDLLPQATALGRGEGLQLPAAAPVHDGDPGRLVLPHADLDLDAFAGRDEQAAEVDPLPVGNVLPRVPRAGQRGRPRPGLTGAGLPLTGAGLCPVRRLP